MTGTQGPGAISPRLQRIANLAKEAPDLAFTNLHPCLDMALMREAYRRTRKSGAVGVDGQTAAVFAENLEENLQTLLDAAKSGTYRAPPVRRVHIPKGDGSKTRPIGVPTFADKVLQRAVAMILEAIYETDFVGWSYGFRPGRSAHDALAVTWKGLMDMHGGTVIEVDIKSFFDELDHAHLRSFLTHRIRDGVLLRLIGKWLNAGVLEEGYVTYPDAGSPQGGVISPILANVYLHEVFDRWFEATVKSRLHGASFAVRYADDIVIALSDRDDARRVMEVLPKRFGKFGLTLHPEKTRAVDFRQPPVGHKPSTEDRPETFDLLGFTHLWVQRPSGTWVVRRKTAAGRFKRAVRTIWSWCRDHRHRPVAWQHDQLTKKLRGHYAYYGVTGNSWALDRFREQVMRAWRRWLHRRSHRARMWWYRFNRLLKRYPLPPARISARHRLVAKP